MKRKASRKNTRHKLWAVLFSVFLIGYTMLTLLQTFVLPSNVVSADEITQTTATTTGNTNVTATAGNTSSDGGTSSDTSSSSDTSAAESSDSADSTSSTDTATVTDTSYEADGVSISITTERVDNTTVYIADIVLDDPSRLMSGLANGSFGRNVTETTSEIAGEVGAILAINGDYYGSRNSGYVMRNGYLYRSTQSSDSGQEDLVIYEDGTMDIIQESEVTAEELEADGAVQIYSFGPGLVEDGEIAVDSGDEVQRAQQSNPRTAIGMIDVGHYVMVVADGRTSESTGLSLSSLASVMQDLGCTVAYNLDGGGSTTMYFNGEVINNPTSNGKTIKERSVSDIVYVA
ncbi:MAG: phosphodiester glycosidase family protein [Bilifractor sp.]|jgi:exopolysaccharide biosynthesis protein